MIRDFTKTMMRKNDVIDVTFKVDDIGNNTRVRGTIKNITPRTLTIIPTVGGEIKITREMYISASPVRLG